MAYDKNNKPQRQAEQFDVNRERELYYAMLADPANHADYKKALGPKVDLNAFLAAARDAVETNPKLLAPSLRSSLLFAVKKAAQQRLKPDGKQGALVPRYNTDARSLLVSWQPMIQGVLHLGRQAGMLKDITAEIVFAGEPFKFMRGDDPKIIHEWLPDIREKAYAYLRSPVKPQADPNDPPDEDQGGPNYAAFWDQVVAAYCIIEGPEGQRLRRAMTRSRILLLRDFSKGKGGPWQSVFLDEMIVKSAIHHAMKHVDTSPKDEEAGRAFRSALDQDMDADLSDLDDDVIDAQVEAAPKLPALSAPNPMDKLARFENNGGDREKVEVNCGEPIEQQQRQQPIQQTETKQPDKPAQEPQQQQKPAVTKPAETKPAQTTAKTSEQVAQEFVDGWVHSLDVEIKYLERTEDSQPLVAHLSNVASQKWIARLKLAFRPKYDEVLRACCNPKVLEAARALETSHEDFYLDLVQFSDEAKATA